MYRKIMICFDGSKGAVKALHVGAKLAKDFDAEIQAVWINDLGTSFTDEEKEAHGLKVRDRLMEIERQEGISVPFHEMGGTPTHDLLFYSRDHQFDLMILGFSSAEDESDPFGQNVSRIVPCVTCSVLVVR